MDLMKLREEIARIVDPAGWATFDRQTAELHRIVGRGEAPQEALDGLRYYTRDSLAKADAILAHPAVLALIERVERPIDMVLCCPSCGTQHIDTPSEQWSNPPHRSHLCGQCGHVWRPADVPTNGVSAVKTRGKADSETPARAALSQDKGEDRG